MSLQAEIAAEQSYIDRAYERLEVMRERARRLGETALRDAGSTHQSMLDRDVFVHLAEKRLAELTIGREALVFGRIDRSDGDKFYIGRLAVSDEHQEPMVVDWRAPVSEPFYRATARNPMGLSRRRHFATKGRRILDIEDELLAESPDDVVLIGEGALMAALERSRTGRMRDIVETIQSEQDEIIRAPLEGILVVQGGPGTGKTAVALHRAAYLLYTHRTRLQRTGVLFVGPNSVFLRYVEHVLPSLGEHEARLATVGNLVPRVRVNSIDSAEVGTIKGDLRMVDVIRNAVRNLVSPLNADAGFWYESHRLVLSVEASRRLVGSLRRSKIPHNVRRKKLEQRVLDHLYNEYKRMTPRALVVSGAGKQDRLEFNEALLTDKRYIEAMAQMWPLRNAEDLVQELLTSRDVLASAAKGILDRKETAAINRPLLDSPVWTEADAALVDEASLHLGPIPVPRRVKEVETEDIGFFVDRVLSDIEGIDQHMKAYLRERLEGEARRDAERAEEEGQEGIRTYGHVVVDEAQDLTAMQWRMVARRCPSGSMTILGDLGQASKPWAPESWDAVVGYLPKVISRRVELTINYRTPVEVMDLAARVLAVASPRLEPPSSVRSAGEAPKFHHMSALDDLAALVAEQMRLVGEGKVAVVVPEPLKEAVMRVIPGASGTESVDVLDVPVAVLTVDQAKGLEFDSVVVVEPAQIAGESSLGLKALYVAMTRTTTRLLIVHSGDLPDVVLEFINQQASTRDPEQAEQRV